MHVVLYYMARASRYKHDESPDTLAPFCTPFGCYVLYIVDWHWIWQVG